MIIYNHKHQSPTYNALWYKHKPVACLLIALSFQTSIDCIVFYVISMGARRPEKGGGGAISHLMILTPKILFQRYVISIINESSSPVSSY